MIDNVSNAALELVLKKGSAKDWEAKTRVAFSPQSVVVDGKELLVGCGGVDTVNMARIWDGYAGITFVRLLVNGKKQSLFKPWKRDDCVVIALQESHETVVVKGVRHD